MAQAINKVVLVKGKNYHYTRIKEYWKRWGSVWLSIDRIVKTKTLKDEIILEIETSREPTKIILNGKELPLTK